MVGDGPTSKAGFISEANKDPGIYNLNIEV